MTNQTTVNNNTILGGIDMNKIVNVLGQLTQEEIAALTTSLLQGVMQKPQVERDAFLAQAGYVAPQPQVDPNTVVLTKETFDGMTQQLAALQNQVQMLMAQQTVAQPQPQAQPVQPVMDANKIARIQQLELDMQAKINQINQLNLAGWNTFSPQQDLKRMQEEYMNLTQTGIKNTALNALDSVANYGQQRIANEFIPGVVNTTSGLVADILNIGADLVNNLGAVAVNTTTQVLQTGANTVGQVGQSVSAASQNYVGNAFGLVRR